MKNILFVLLLLISFPAQAYDAYQLRCNSNWQTITDIDNEPVQSIYMLSDKELRLMTNAYEHVQKSFFAFYAISAAQCRQNQVRILIVNQDALDSRICFPDEYDYARKGEILFGRYFKTENALYIVSPNLKAYPRWKDYFAHELAHHFFNDCGWKFESDYVEHLYVEKFLSQCRTTF